MDTLTVNLDGISTDIERLKIGLKQLILDIVRIPAQSVH